MVVDYVCASAAVVEAEQRVDGLPAGRDRHVGALPVLEALVYGPLVVGEVFADFLAQHRRPDRASIAMVVSQPHAACVTAALQAGEDLKQRVVTAAAAVERRYDHRKAQVLALGHPRHRVQQRRGPVAPA